MKRYVCVHGHFYQPPRENPWLEGVEVQTSAHPYHDWNDRITAECYAPNATSRVMDPEGRIIDIRSNYSRISFNFGPTLLSWMKENAPEVYQALLEADRESLQRFSGHGSAMAQCYNHMIMPLASARDKRTQVLWGMEDFRRRFGRDPEGMWLPETAADLETLDILAENGIRFTVLAPRQAKRVRKIGRRGWQDVGEGLIDPRRAYLCRLPSGREIALFFYDGAIAQDLAFGDLLANGETYASRLLAPLDADGDISHVATDGETYGHHHAFGDMALAYCLHHIESGGRARLTVYGEYLEKHPPRFEVEIHEDSSWSCIHGVERWRADCGCDSGGRPGWSQAWRGPLRGALDWLRDNAAELYQEQASKLLRDPWGARDAYISVVLDRSPLRVAGFLSEHALRRLSPEETVRALNLLEMQRHAMLMYTSCGWFFDEVSGIETVQVLQYAARAIQLAELTGGVSFEHVFLDLLERAPSNMPELKTGAEAFRRYVRPSMVDLLRVGVHYAVASLFRDEEESREIYCYTVESRAREITAIGKHKLLVGRVLIRSSVTLAGAETSYAILHMGDHEIVGGAREFLGAEEFQRMTRELEEAFSRGSFADVIRLIDDRFEGHNYSIWHLFRDEQRLVLDKIFETALREVRGVLRQAFDNHYPTVQAVVRMGMPIPRPLLAMAEFVLDTELRAALEAKKVDMGRLARIAGEIQASKVPFDKATAGFLLGRRVNALAERFAKRPDDDDAPRRMIALLETGESLGLDLDLARAQNLYIGLCRRRLAGKRGFAAAGDGAAADWMRRCERMGELLKVRVDSLCASR
ncbi:MAG: DUF3536 domain-containing protein [Elusimicrobiota bacterium]